LTFSTIDVTATVSGTGLISLGTLTYGLVSPGEYGFSLAYNASAGVGPGTADVALAYTVSGTNITDAFLSLTASVVPNGYSGVSENLGLGLPSLSVSGTGTDVVTFPAQTSILANKDNTNFVGTGETGIASSSILADGFSVSTVPIPATLPLLATGLFGLWGMSRKRRKGSRLGSAQAT
jgi:hypothetical protein